MSTPENPLLKLNTYMTQHVIAAFVTTSSAENTKLGNTSGDVGDPIGDGVIIVNEFTDPKFSLKSIVWDWSRGDVTTSMTGLLQISDRTGGQFVDWLTTFVIPTLGVSTQHMVFALKTYFMGVDRKTEKFETITGNPLIFHVHEVMDMMNVKGAGTVINLKFSTAYNTTAQRVNLKPYQVTLTHKDGALDNSAPDVTGTSSGILPRSEEDSIKETPRITRIDKSKPMKTLDDIFGAFEKELNQQPFAHKRQVQQWLSTIRDDYVFKVDPDPVQERGQKLPIKFEVLLDDVYKSYEVDNRDLPFEQPEEDAQISGVRSIPFRAGANIHEMITTLMKYSRAVGDEAKSPTPKTFKTNISYIKETAQLKIVIKIKQIDAPVNTRGVDTGPGKAIAALEFDFKSGEKTDVDIMYLKTSIVSDDGVKTLEITPRQPVFGNREPVMVERIPQNTAGGDQFFKSEFSGLRAPIVPYLNSGKEDGAAAANIDGTILVKNKQPSSHEIEITGNPELMFDMHRKPSEAASLNSPGSANLYIIPESYPMYLKINIFLDADANIGLIPEQLAPKYYYQNYYEITKITNMISNGVFKQIIQLAKRDDII